MDIPQVCKQRSGGKNAMDAAAFKVNVIFCLKATMQSIMLSIKSK
jgi:hypothetical protein